MAKQNRISHAWLLTGWDFAARDTLTLTTNGEAIPPEDYTPEMKTNIFCPGCFMPLFRSPSKKARFSNKRVARFNHYPSYSDVECGLKAPKAEALRFATEELARQAIDNGKLTVVNGFYATAPEVMVGAVNEGGVTYFNDTEGPVANCAVSRHRGESFALPTRISSVASICRRFDINLFKYYLFPGRTSALMLSNELVDLTTVTEPDETPRLYFAKIIQSERMGKSDQNLRMTYFSCHAEVRDFCLKATIAVQRDKGINDGVVNRIVLIWGKVSESGIGLCLDRPKWGEFALLPAQYERLLPKGQDQ